MTRSITSKSNAQFRETLALQNRRGRKKAGQFLIDGSREVKRAIDCGFELHAIYVCQASSNRESAASSSVHDLHVVTQWAGSRNLLWHLDQELMSKLSYGQRESDCVAVAVPKAVRLSDIPFSPAPLFVVLDNVEKPGNVGAVFRSADAAGAGAVFLTGQPADVFNPNAIRASAGTVFSMPSVAIDAVELCEFLATGGVKIATARVDGSLPYWDLTLNEPVAIVLGNEADGLPASWDSLSDQSFHIPMAGIADSLNVSVTSSLVLFEAKRQRLQAL